MPPPFCLCNYTCVVAQYNCILNVQLPKASVLHAGGGIFLSLTRPLSVNHAHFSLIYNFSLLPPPPPPLPFKIPGSVPGMLELKTHAAQLGWNTCTCNCWDLRSAGTYILNAHRFSFHLHVLDYLFLSHSTCHIMTYHTSGPIFHYMHPFRHSHTHTDTTLTTIPCQSPYTLKL